MSYNGDNKDSMSSSYGQLHTLGKIEQQIQTLIVDVLEMKTDLKAHLKEGRLEEQRFSEKREEKDKATAVELTSMKVDIGVLKTKATAWGALGGAITTIVAIAIAIIAKLF